MNSTRGPSSHCLLQTIICSLFSDNLPAIECATWFLHTHSFDGDVAAGPMPILFAANPEAAAAAINSDPARAHFDLSKVFKHRNTLCCTIFYAYLTSKQSLLVLSRFGERSSSLRHSLLTRPNNSSKTQGNIINYTSLSSCYSVFVPSFVKILQTKFIIKCITPMNPQPPALVEIYLCLVIQGRRRDPEVQAAKVLSSGTGTCRQENSHGPHKRRRYSPTIFY
jgi:hypothetical protein